MIMTTKMTKSTLIGKVEKVKSKISKYEIKKMEKTINIKKHVKSQKKLQEM